MTLGLDLPGSGSAWVWICWVWIWVDLGGGIDTGALLDRATDLRFIPGSRCAVERNLSSFARLSFSFYEGRDGLYHGLLGARAVPRGGAPQTGVRSGLHTSWIPVEVDPDPAFRAHARRVPETLAAPDYTRRFRGGIEFVYAGGLGGDPPPERSTCP